MAPLRVEADRPVVVVGAGPAGLTAAYELVRRQAPVVVCDGDHQVGGLSRTVCQGGFRFDIGGHRFYTKSEPVLEMWREVLGNEFLRRPRLSRIFYRGRFFDYPLKPLNVLFGLGAWESVRVLLSYAWATVHPVRPEVSFADWVSNRFGRRLYRIFFETYTEKVWGIPPSTIGAQWAAQRIKGLSLASAVRHMLFPARGKTARTLIEEFDYPRFGPGMMWEAVAERIEAAGGRIRLESWVSALHHADGRIVSVDIERGGQREPVPAGHVISTMAIRDLVNALVPAPPSAVLDAARRLKYRDFLTVALVLDSPDVFPDNWIYIHDESVRVGRIQNFKNWSPEMVPHLRQTCLGLEYFCFEGDGLWSMSDADLVALATRELRQLGLSGTGPVTEGYVVRARKAYPVYDEGYMDALRAVRAYLETFENLQLVGRNGMHKYNNQDHSMLTAMLAVRNLYGEQHDLWALNTDDEYGEEVQESKAATDGPLREVEGSQPRVPRAMRVDRDV
ncbi:MAG: NAD(P)/FAD-dependent oxidoreductase [Vicinamibacterales bacterium]